MPKNKKSTQFDRNLCSTVYKERAEQHSLFDSTKRLNLNARLSEMFAAKFYALKLSELEQFVDVLLNCDEVPFVQDSRPGFENNYLPASPAARFFTSVPDFIEVVNLLSPRYEYSERITVFIACARSLGLLDIVLDWKKSHVDLPKIDPRFNGATAADIFNALVSNIRHEWKIKKTQAKVDARKKRADDRYDDYLNYVKKLFDHCARLVVLRIDLLYQKQYANDKSISHIREDLTHLTKNKRGKPLIFNSLKGYIAKLEYGPDKGMHWHVLFFFDGSKRNNSSHVHLAESIGQYWIDTVTKGSGDYWNVNAKADDYDKKGMLGIGPINYDDADLRKNLNYIIGYLCKIDQFIKPLFGTKVKLFRRGNYPKLPRKP
jgi:hypothetical protein